MQTYIKSCNLQRKHRKIAHKDTYSSNYLTHFVLHHHFISLRLREFLNYCTAPYKYMGGNRPKE